jgi:uncharacterized membrane protein
VKDRYYSFDALRGLIMILMAIDHASAFIARQHASEFWAGAMSAYSSALPFLTRLVTHLCAPGFFFLLGAGVYWFAASRRQAGWNEARIVRRAAVRGLAVFLTGQVLETPVMYLQSLLKPAAVSLNRITAPPPVDGSALYWGFITLSGLGLVMIACALLLRLPRWCWWATMIACVFVTNTLLPASGKAAPLWQAILYVPGLSQHVFVIYPVLPWLAGAAGGMLFAHWWQANPDTAAKRVWLLALGLIALGVALRAMGGWGNIRLPRDAGWIEFLNNVKYPPSLVFWCLALGVDLLLLSALRRVPKTSPLVTIGQTPLFFYLVHFYLLWVLAYVFFPEAPPLEAAYGVWFAVIIVLYPLCRWYRDFKLGKPPESLWRLF